MRQPTFSVAIPAWGSSKYIADALSTIAETREDDVEVFVSLDPGSPDFDETLEVLQSDKLGDFFLIHPPKPLSMAEHYEWCLSHLSGEFVTILGADDGLMPWAFRLMRQIRARNNDVQAVIFRRAYYFWPGVEWEYGATRISVTSRDLLHHVSGKRLLRKVFRGQAEHFDLPQIYTNNFVRNDVVSRIRKMGSGRVYHERNPDVFSGVAVAHFAKNIVRCETPAFWTGTSGSSMGLRQREAVVGGSAAAMRSVQRDFIARSADSGHDVAPEVGNELWLTAQDSPIYTLSAYLQYLRVMGQKSRSVHRTPAVALAFAAAIFRSSDAEGIQVLGVGGQAEAVRRLVHLRCAELGLPYPLILALSAALRIASGPRRRIKKLLRRMTKRLGVAQRTSTFRLKKTSDDGYHRLGEANRHIASLEPGLYRG